MLKGECLMETREMICIGCPLGCNLTVKIDGENVEVSGNTCNNGVVYANNEIKNPTRIVTSTVKVLDGDIERVSCKTETAIPKGKIFDCMAEIRKKKVNAPVRIGDVLISDVAGTGINVIATKNIEKEG